MENGKILIAEGVAKRFPGITALKDFHFELLKGEVHALIGENGAGKSTFIKILSGVYSPDEGQLEIYKKTMHHFSPNNLKRNGVATVFQELSLIPQLSIEENIFLGKEETKYLFINKNNRRELANRYLQMLEGQNIGLQSNRIVSTLRAGERRLIEFLKAISDNPKILILDEPTEALSDVQTKVLFKTIKQLKDQGIGIVYISHKLSEIFEIADRVTILRDGISRGTYAVSEVTIDKMIKLMVGREIRDLFPERKIRQLNSEDVILNVTNLNVTGRIQDISFQVRRGEIVGISGLVGAGRTELAMAILGLLPKDGGTIWFDNKLLNKISPESTKNLGIGLIPEDRYQEGLVSLLSVKQNIILPACERKQYSGRVFLKDKDIRSKVHQLIKSINIKSPHMDVRVTQLSGGNQQKVVIARSLCSESKLFIFDEPTQGVDVGSKMEIYQIIKGLAEQKAGIILISSDLKEILGLTDRILVMRKGKIVSSYQSEEATEEQILTDALHS